MKTKWIIEVSDGVRLALQCSVIDLAEVVWCMSHAALLRVEDVDGGGFCLVERDTPKFKVVYRLMLMLSGPGCVDPGEEM